MRCLKCQHENISDAKFCNQCGTPFVPQCSACGCENAADAKFCNQCGMPVTTPTSDSDSVHTIQQRAETESRFQTLILALIQLLQHENRISYRTLKHRLGVDQALLEDVRKELTFRQLARDEEGEGLVWTGEDRAADSALTVASSQPPTVETTVALSAAVSTPPTVVTPTENETSGSTVTPENSPTDDSSDEPVVMPEPARSVPEAERRQLTVMFCDLVGSTDLSGRLDPEDLREVVRAYQEAAAEIIEHYEGYIAQYLGDGLLIYFGYPVAHEDDAQHAVHSGLEIPQAMVALNTRLEAEYGVQLSVRIGIHTGPVVVGEMGGGDRHENLALGETPNIAARLEGLAQANTAVISPVTAQLVQRAFVLEELGPHDLKGVAEPMMLYAVLSPRKEEPDDHEAMLAGGFDVLVGRDEEIGLLLRRWEQSKESQGQVVLISGEAGLGKSSLVEGLRAHVRQEGYTRIVFRCSPYTTNSMLHPVIEHVQRVLGWQREAPTAETKLTKLEQMLAGTGRPLAESVPLIAALLSLPLPEGRYPALTLTPEQQREQTQDLLVAWMLEEAERQPMLIVWEDLHWADPSTLQVLGLFIEQTQTVSMLNVLVFRPEFTPPWPSGSHLTPLTLNRLERGHIEVLVKRLAGGKDLPAEVAEHIVAKTDGVPLYVEELTKMLLESDLLEEETEFYVLTGLLSDATIPATLQDSLMARLDRSPTVKEVAQLGAVLGREFAYEMLQALMIVEEPTLQDGLGQLVGTEMLYQRGRIPRSKYIFRHVLIRDAAYQSLLRRTRQRVHQQVAQLFEARFPEVVATQPELVAHHYTEAGLVEQAIGYWHRAGERAVEQSAHVEAIAHFTTGLELLRALPDTTERWQHELTLQLSLGGSLHITKGQAAPEVEHAYSRAHALCQLLEDTPQLFPALFGLFRFYDGRAQLQTSRALGEQLLSVAQQTQDLQLLMIAHYALGRTRLILGDFGPARTHFEESLAFYDPQQRDSPVIGIALRDLEPACQAHAAVALWFLGYPDQAMTGVRDALSQAQTLAIPFRLAHALTWTAILHLYRREGPATQTRAEEAIALADEQGFTWSSAQGRFCRSWALTEQGLGVEGVAQMRQSLTAWRATGAEVGVTLVLTKLAEACGQVGQAEEGLTVLSEARALVDKTKEGWWEAELHRLRGELLLSLSVDNRVEAAACFQQALNIARHQHAKSWELRAATSLARLWQQQRKHQEAHELLAPVYGWFTEGFDTADLIEAKHLLDELSEEVRTPTA